MDKKRPSWELFVADGSVCPIQGSANPALTIMALSSRLAARLASKHTSPRSTAHPRRGLAAVSLLARVAAPRR
jgi:choline dehydrogenase-like flavoprotein